MIKGSGGTGFFKVFYKMQSILLSTAYLPPLNYLSKLIEAEQVVIEKQEYFVKQTYRNRCEILTANGILSLSIPLIKQADKEIISEKKISYAENWQKQHWRAITSAYKNSPYFEYFEDEFRPFYENQFEFLFEYNTQLLNAILNILRIKKSIGFTTQFETLLIGITDLRNLSEINNINVSVMKPYYQVFADKQGFTPNLSCLDTLFNVGLETKYF
ncbi:MAG: WbqC family protein [Burkholderiales bacterium]|nr:WbqC family protein [Bacteroidia bacterium]